MPSKVLVVEDNLQNMRLVRKILTAAGYNVLEALDGLTGITLASREMPELILMDINLPDINGLEATGRIKASPQLAWIPIVALTANAMHGDRENCLAAGCNGYLAKPVLKAELLSAVENFIFKGAIPGKRATSEIPTIPPIMGGGAFPSSGLIENKFTNN